jgi:uncharacterized protein YciI
MSYFAVIREAGPGWADGKATMEQPGIEDHAGFMNGLAEHGSLVLAGPLAGTEHDRIRALLIINAASEDEINHLLADDPWTASGQLEITNIESWNLFVGAPTHSRTPAPAAGRE